MYYESECANAHTAYAHKDFPGMLESTFLTRSFGDQGVKLKTRKEPRTLGVPV